MPSAGGIRRPTPPTRVETTRVPASRADAAPLDPCVLPGRRRMAGQTICPTIMTIPTLSLLETRILGVLVEKQHTVPDSYPLSLNALTLGCNQKTARDPV